MKTFDEAWNTQFYANQVSADALGKLMVAAMVNLTGARAVTDGAFINPNSRLSAKLQPFYDTVMFTQRDYHDHPDHKIVILGNGPVPESAIIVDDKGETVFDPLADRLVSHSQDFYLYRKPTGYAQHYDPQPLRVLATVGYLEGVKFLREQGLWKDNSWGRDQDFARGSNYL